MKIEKIGIVGLGILGFNLFKYFDEEEKYKVFGYDVKGITEDTWGDIEKCDVIFLCLPTPYREGKKGYNLSAIKETLKKIPEGKVVIIKSTVLPGTTNKFQKEYPKLKLMFIPEFLTERYAWEDTVHPDTNIVGYTKKSYSIARDIMTILPEASFERIMPAIDAEVVKMARNNYFINKIVYANTLYDVCEEIGANYENVKDAFASDRRIRKSHLEIFHQGGRGGAGKCFSKDGPAWRDFIESLNDERAKQFTDIYIQVNQSLIQESGKDTGNQYA